MIRNSNAAAGQTRPQAHSPGARSAPCPAAKRAQAAGPQPYALTRARAYKEKGRRPEAPPFLVLASRRYQLNRKTNWIVRAVFVPLSAVIW